VRNGQWSAEAVLSYNFWQRRFGGDPEVVGRTIHLNTYPFTIVGVSPPSFTGLVRGTNYELRIPILPDGQEMAQIRQISGAPRRWMNTVARMKPGETLSRAQALADAEFQDFLHTTTDQEVKEGGFAHLQVTPGLGGYFTDEYVQPFRAPLFVLLGMVAIVLLIVCSNVAGMLLARGAARAREFAIRVSIGAGRFRLIRQMLAESLLLSFLGGALGLALSYWLSEVLFHFLPQGHINIVLDLRPDARVAAFTFTISLFTAALFGLAPALEATRSNLTNALKSDISSSTSRFRKILVMFQVAFSLVLLIAAGVFVRTLAGLRPSEYRGNPDHLLLFTMKPQQEIYTEARRKALVEELARRMSGLAGVQSVAFAENGALGSRTDRTMVEVPGQSPIRASSDLVTPGFFDTAGIQRIAGRDFDARDGSGLPLAAVVNQALARALYGSQNPLGRSLTAVADGKKQNFEIVGVVADTHYYDVHKAPGPFVWFSMAQVAPYMPTLHVRTNVRDTAAVVAAVRQEFDLVDKGFPVFNIRTMEARIDDSMAGERMVANLAGAFGSLALVLAAIGLYGILAYSVARRTREIGIRMALGARPGSVLWLVAREALLLVGAGSVAGVFIAAIARPVAMQYLGDASPVDAGIIAACTVGMFFIAAAAVAAPAFRGCRVDPLSALRHN
jgi:predicted permease